MHHLSIIDIKKISTKSNTFTSFLLKKSKTSTPFLKKFLNMETAINKVYSLLEPLTLKRLHKREQEGNEVNKTSGKYKWLKEKKG